MGDVKFCVLAVEHVSYMVLHFEGLIQRGTHAAGYFIQKVHL